MYFRSFAFLGMGMDEAVKNARRRQAPVARVGGARAWVVLGLPLFALFLTIPGGTAAGQSAATVGAALDQPITSDSLLSSGAFRLDGPSEDPAHGDNSDPHAGVTSLGLQIYGSAFGSGPRPAETETPTAPSLGSVLTRP
jgi:hypothetical protein